MVIGLSLTTQKSAGNKRNQRTDRKQGTEGHTHLDPTRQLFHGISGCSNLPRHVKTDQSMDRNGKLEALNLPRLGILIEAGKLNEFFAQRKSKSG
jgi:hypothetical protein